jgi:biotin transport system substrate-specific component
MTDAPEHVPAGPVALPADGSARPVARTSVTTDIALVATFAAFIAVCAFLPRITVPGVPVPITLQTFGVMLAGLVLGARRGGLAVLLYLVVGLAGLPVFSGGTGGPAVLAGPTAGYLVAFPLAAALAGLLATRAARVRPALRYWALFASAMTASLLLIHPLGILVMGWRADLSPAEAVALGATFLPGDVLKNLVAALVASAVFRAFPDLLHQRR